MEPISINLTTTETLDQPHRLVLQQSISFKSLIDLAEQVLKIEVFALYVNNQRLTDVCQLRDGDTVFATDVVPSQHNRSSHLGQIDDSKSMISDMHSNATQLRVVVMGPEGAGKTSLILRFMHGFFKSNNIKTFVQSEYDKYLQVHGDEVYMSVLDTAGELTDEKISRTWMADRNAYILALGVDKLDQWPEVLKLRKTIKRMVVRPLIFVLITKIDLLEKMDKASFTATKLQLDKIEGYCKDRRLFVYKTSAKANKKVNEVFLAIANSCLEPERGPKSNVSVDGMYKQPYTLKFLSEAMCRAFSCFK